MALPNREVAFFQAPFFSIFHSNFHHHRMIIGTSTLTCDTCNCPSLFVTSIDGRFCGGGGGGESQNRDTWRQLRVREYLQDDDNMLIAMNVKSSDIVANRRRPSSSGLGQVSLDHYRRGGHLIVINRMMGCLFLKEASKIQSLHCFNCINSKPCPMVNWLNLAYFHWLIFRRWPPSSSNQLITSKCARAHTQPYLVDD